MDRPVNNFLPQGTGEAYRNYATEGTTNLQDASRYQNAPPSSHPPAPLLRQLSAARITPKPLTRIDSRQQFSPVSGSPPRAPLDRKPEPYYQSNDTARSAPQFKSESINKGPADQQSSYSKYITDPRQSNTVSDSAQRPLKVPDSAYASYDRPKQDLTDTPPKQTKPDSVPEYSYQQFQKSQEPVPQRLTKVPENNYQLDRAQLPENSNDYTQRIQRQFPEYSRDNRTDVPARARVNNHNNVDTAPKPFEQGSESRPNYRDSIDNRPNHRGTLDNRLNHREDISDNRSIIRDENRTLQREVLENRIGSKESSENRPGTRDFSENRSSIENRLASAPENRSIIECVESRPVPSDIRAVPTQDIRPLEPGKRVEVPGDRPRPEPPPLVRQPSAQNLQQPAPPFRAPSAGVRLFRQLVNQQLIPPRVPPQHARQDGMGLNLSHSEDHTRLIKLARTEMESPSPRPETERVNTSGERPVRVEQTVHRKPVEQPSFPDMQQPDSLTSLKSNIMPSGKPVAKEMTITVTGKLPPQPQPARPKPEINNRTPEVRTQPPTQVRKPEDRRFESNDTMRHADSNLGGIESQPRREPERSDSNLYSNNRELDRNDSSGNLSGYRRTEEFAENGRRLAENRTSEQSFYINEAAAAAAAERQRNSELKQIDSNLARTNLDSENMSMGYLQENNSEHSENGSKRPSELNLSGLVSEKKNSGRVGWKSSEDPPRGEKKISGRSTPTDKGVSFVETPRKKTSETKIPGTWCAQTGRFIPLPFERPKSPDPRPKTPTTPKKKRFVGTYCAKTGRYIPPSETPQTPRTPDDRRTPDLRLPGSGRSTPDVTRRVRSAVATPRDESPHVSFIEERCYTPRVPKKPHIAFGSVVPEHIVQKKRQKVRRTKSNDWIERQRITDGDHDSGVDESTQEHATSNGDVKGAQSRSRAAANSKIPGAKRASTPGSPASSPLKSPNKPQGSRSASLTPEPTAERKKVPMNKIQVGTAASPNLKTIRSKIGSLDNATHKPGGGQVRIESRKVDFTKSAAPRIAAKNDQYQPGGGDKKIASQKLQWNAKSKIGSLENTTHKPGGGDKKIESQKLEFKEKAKSKVGSKDNIKHTPGGGNVKIEEKKLEFNVTSKVGSLANVTHKPGGGDVKIFDDKEYLRQMSGGQNSTGTHSKASSEGQPSGTQSPVPTSPTVLQPGVQSPLSPSRS